MAVIAEIPGGDTNKKPVEVEKKAQEEDKQKTCCESLPFDVTEQIVASVQRCDYPAISLISKAFGRLIASPELYLARSRLAVVERFVYALIRVPPHEFPSWYILYRSSNDNSLRLRRINSLPPMPSGSAVVTIGPAIYVIGGRDANGNTSDMILIDCRTHEIDRSLPRMKVARYRAAAGVIDGKIFVIGGCEVRSWDWVEAFDLERHVWLRWTWSVVSNMSQEFVTYAVMKEKIYGLVQSSYCYAYEPKERKLQTWDVGHELTDLWQGSSCVIDGMLYTIDPECSLGHLIIVFDPEKEVWRPVKNLFGLPPSLYWYPYDSKMTNLDGKLVILVGNQNRWWNSLVEKCIWCVEISLETRQGGEIWGKVESVDVVYKSTDTVPTIELSRTVIV